MDIIAAILKRPMIEIAEIVGLVILIISAIGFSCISLSRRFIARK